MRIKKYFSFFIVALVALQILNLGLYAQDFDTIGTQEGREFNIINSVTEYIAEVQMNKHNAFPEKKERPNQTDHEPIIKFQPFKIILDSSSRLFEEALAQQNDYNKYLAQSYTNHTSDILSPPPRMRA